MKQFISLFLVLFMSLCFVKAQDKIIILKAEDLPKHSYELKNKDAVAIVQSKESILELAAMVKENLLADLNKYDIKQRASLRDYYYCLRVISVLEGDYVKALEYISNERELADKESEKITMGISTEAFINAVNKSKTMDAKVIGPQITQFVEEKLNAVDFKLIQEQVEAAKGNTEMLSENILLGILKSQFQQAIDNNKAKIPGDLIMGLIVMYYTLNYDFPYLNALNIAYTNVLDENVENVVKHNIWNERDVALEKDANYAPVIIGVWDTGVDMPVFSENARWVNEKEKVDGKDTDGNGFVDDVYGIAYNLYGLKDSGYLIPIDSYLFPVDNERIDIKSYQKYIKGLSDLNANINSNESTDVKTYVAQLNSDDINDFIEKLNLYGNYAHGTHVAGIVVAGNPYAKILTARLTFDYKNLPESPTKETAQNWANMFQETIAYFKANNVRVVNMSWTVDFNFEFMRIFELNGIGENDEERKQLAKEYFEIEKEGYLKAIGSAPEILFVCAAGNDNNDTDFVGSFPASLNLPNLLTVGAVGVDGRKTSFTTEGKSVDVFANGYEVKSYIPGGDIVALSGTSMASPQVVNLAAKILAINPNLKPEEVVKIIIETSTKSDEDERVLLINPKSAVELVSK